MIYVGLYSAVQATRHSTRTAAINEVAMKSKSDPTSIKERLNEKFKKKTADSSAKTSDAIPEAEIISDVSTSSSNEASTLDPSLVQVEVTAKLIAEQVYDNALIAAGLVDDPRSMLTRLNKILTAVIPVVPATTKK